MYTLSANFNSWPLLIFSQTHHEIIVVCCKAYCNSLNYETEWTNDNSFHNWERGGGGGSSGFAVTYLTFCQNFAVGSAEEVWFRCLFFYTLKVTLLMREFLAALVSIITFFFQTTSLAWFYFVFPALPHHFSNGPSLKLWIINNAYVNRDTGSQTCSGYTSDLWCFQVLNSDLQCNCWALGYKRVVENLRNTTVDQRWSYKRETACPCYGSIFFLDDYYFPLF